MLRRSISLSVFIVLLAGSVVICGCTRSELVQQTPGINKVSDSFRVMTYNIHHGEGMDGQIDLERIARVIREQQADIVALQEVDVGVERSKGLNIMRELSELTGLKHYAFGKNLDHQGGAYGNATLSGYPIVEHTNTLFTKLGPEQRGILQTVLNVDGRPLLLLNTHLDHREEDEERLVNINEIREKVLSEYETKAVIIAGDFNDVPESATHKQVKEFMTDAWEVTGKGAGLTSSSDNLRRRIDYLFHNSGMEALKAWVPETLASDHLPVVVEFNFRK